VAIVPVVIRPAGNLRQEIHCQEFFQEKPPLRAGRALATIKAVGSGTYDVTVDYNKGTFVALAGLGDTGDIR
jgi:hypothetical protein